MRVFKKSSKLDEVCYDIRGPVLKEAKRLEAEGFRILKLNIGNPAAFGFNAPDEILHDMIVNLQNPRATVIPRTFPRPQGDHAGFPAKGVMDVGVEDIYIGNGVSELIVMAMQGLLDAGDEVLVPAPDYPLWTAAVNLAAPGRPLPLRRGGRLESGHRRHPRQDESPTKAIVVINPNNPTGAV
jgi:alanine-synthesizing transaminase